MKYINAKQRTGIAPDALFCFMGFYSIRKNFFCSSQSAGSPVLRDLSVMCSGNAPMSARWMISGESCANWSVWDTTARSAQQHFGQRKRFRGVTTHYCRDDIGSKVDQ
jgi:hypothetical protein